MRATNIILFLAASAMATSLEKKEPSQSGRQACDDDAYWRCGEQSTACEKAKEHESQQALYKACGTAFDDKFFECSQSHNGFYSIKECIDNAKTCVVSALMI